REILHFDFIKENRGSYFVEYQPPVSNNPFATLNLVYPESYDLGFVADTMKAEVAHWLVRYPVPIMAWAFDAAEKRIRPHGDADDGLLVGWYAPGTATLTYAWKVEGLPLFLNDTTNLPDWRTIYKDVPFRTGAEVKANANREWIKTRKQNLTLRVILVIWLAVIPAAWAIIQYLGPEWLAIAVLLYSLWQAFRAARKLFWRVEPSKVEKEKAETNLRRDHYFYHCELNPEGFARLKVENFEREAKERIVKEAEALRNKTAE
ncbi:MAG TPA: hypothetical protein VN821_12950, partial [Candidatus Udaeobacter sp.]|nr:hypothetical protein [Candidatus Udaeobacter sp.]